MGGNLFGLPRMPHQEYLERETALREYLDGLIGRSAYQIPRWYAMKEDFGDIDVVIATDFLPAPWPDIQQQIQRDLSIERTKKTGAVWSTVWRGIQTDFLVRAGNRFHSTCNFLDWNDLGNILGKMFHRLGCKYGEHGLSTIYRGADSHFKRELLIDTNPVRIFGVLGLEISPWMTGFDALEDIFEWATGSPFFSTQPYLNDASPATRRRRKRRETMRRFVAWLEQPEQVARRDAGWGSYQSNPDRSTYIPMLASHFPQIDLVGWLDMCLTEETETKQIRARFNGRIVMALIPGICGHRLGKLISWIQARRSDRDDSRAWSRWVLAATDDEIRQEILGVYAMMPAESS